MYDRLRTLSLITCEAVRVYAAKFAAVAMTTRADRYQAPAGCESSCAVLEYFYSRVTLRTAAVSTRSSKTSGHQSRFN